MPAKSDKFSSGNFNSWNKLVKEVFPKTTQTIRETLIPQLDNVLTSMLGHNSDWIKQNIDISQIFEKNIITGLNCEITYLVDDFKVSSAPPEAINTDCNSIQQAMTNEDFTVKEVKINTASGELKINFEVLFEDNNDQNRIPQKSN